MASLLDFTGITKLRDAWPKWKANVAAVNNQVIDHVAGTADKHAAQDITYSGSFTSKTDIKAALDRAKEEIDLIVVSASIDPEVAFARESLVKGKTFGTLDARLEESEQDLASLDSQLAAIATNASSIGVTSLSTSAQIETALNLLNDGTTVNFNGIYTFDTTVNINKKLKFKGNNANFTFANPFTYKNGNELTMFNVNVDGFEIDGIEFTTPIGLVKGSLNNTYIWNNNGKCKITRCNFKNLPIGGTNLNCAVGFLITGIGFNIVDKCYFENCPGAVFTKQPHSIITKCLSNNPNDVSFVLNGETNFNSSITDCIVYNVSNSVSMHMGVEQGVSNFIIANNNIFGIKDGIGIGCLSVGGVTSVGDTGIIANNIIDGGSVTTVNPCAGISISPYYTNLKIHDNIIKNIGGGNSSSSSLLIYTGTNTDVEIYNNKILNPNTICPIYISGAAVTSKIKIYNNIIDGGTKAYCIFVSGSDLTGLTIEIKDNDLRNSTEGIKCTATAITDLLVENNEYSGITSPINLPSIFGVFIRDNFNIHGKRFPHRLSLIKQMFFYSNNANAVPTSGTFKAIDEIFNIDPGGGSYSSQLCITAGSPGVWKGKGIIQV